ncbi:lipase family protein [Streptomyces sp. NPDC059168]|uniref:lipase family protein n=1 Tax=Streptomyces sp. NPDC059168 TaxID=3346753 RepID=UPI0036C95911
MPARTRLPLLAVAVAACLGAQTAAALPATASDTVVSRGVTIPAFYDPPAGLPAADGTLVRSEHLPLALRLPGPDGPLPGRATRLMYKSTDSGGSPVAVTGAYIEPSAAWKHGGPRPLVAVAPGTMGQGDQCAASRGLERPVSVNGRTLSIGYENLAIYRMLAKGIAVVVTDYMGLGATDRPHTYVNRVDGGHAVLDAVRAARNLPGTSLTAASPVGLYGYSEGGGATAAAAELQPSYAPDVTLAGTYSGAPPADLTAVTKAIDGSDLAGALGWAVNGFLQAAPALRPIADKRLNAAGKAALADLSTMCVADAILHYNSVRSTAWTADGSSLGDVVEDEPALRDFLDRQRIGRTKPASPVRVATGVSDDLVPHAQARRLAVDWCHKGADVTYVPVLVPPLGRSLLNHVTPLIADQGNAIGWLTDRLSGRPARSTCWSLPLRP